MSKIPQEQIDEIVRLTDFVQLVGRYTQLRQQGGSWLGLCPFHSEKTPSFRVNPERGLYHCFGCKEGGGVPQFLMKVESLTFVEAIRRLGKEVGIELEIEDSVDPEEGKKRRLYELLERCSLYYHELLLRSPLGREGLTYLERRGLDRAVMEKFRLGWAPPGGQALLQRLQKSGYGVEEGCLVGVLRESRGRVQDTLRGRVVFPIFDTQDRVLAFGGRLLDESGPKYLNTPETLVYSKRRILYGLNVHRQEISRQDRAVLVEGYLDVISLSQVGVSLSVASLGTALTSEQSQLLRRYTRNCLLAYDADGAGQNATVKALEVFETAGLRAQIAQLAEGEDPDSLARQQGKAGVEQMLASAVSVVDYLITRSEARFDVSRPEGKEDVIREVLPAIEKIQDRNIRDGYVVRLANRLKVKEEQLHWRLSSRRQGKVLTASRRKLDPRCPEAALFRVCVTHSEWLGRARESFSPEHLVEDRFRLLFEVLWRLEIGERPLQLQDLSPHIEDSEALADLTELLLEPPPTTTADDVEKLIQTLQSKRDELRLEQLRREVQASLEAGTLNPDDERYQEYYKLLRKLKGAR